MHWKLTKPDQAKSGRSLRYAALYLIMFVICKYVSDEHLDQYPGFEKWNNVDLEGQFIPGWQQFDKIKIIKKKNQAISKFTPVACGLFPLMGPF